MNKKFEMIWDWKLPIDVLKDNKERLAYMRFCTNKLRNNIVVTQEKGGDSNGNL